MTPAGNKPSGTIGADALIALNDEIAALARAGVPLELGLQATELRSGGQRGLSGRLAERMRSGRSLADALADEGPTVPPVYRAVVEAGLRAGRLPEALESLSDGLRSLLEVRRRLTRATIYPTVIVIVAYLLFVGFVLYVVPTFLETYSLFRLPMRLPISILEWLRRTVGSWGAAIPLLAGIWFITGTPIFRRFAGGSAIIDLRGGSFRRWPGAGRVVRDYQYANFAHLLGMLLDHEVPLDRAVELASAGSGNPDLEVAAERIADSVRKGRGLADSLTAHVRMPATMHWMIASGERERALVPTLGQIESLYRSRAASRARWLEVTAPLLLTLVFGGGAVLLYALLLFVPLSSALWDLSRPIPGS